MINTILFDLDGTLIETKQLHRDCFLGALEEVTGLRMSAEEHDSYLCGLSTRQKLNKFNLSNGPFTRVILSEEKELINREKQRLTAERLGCIELLPSVRDTIQFIAQQPNTRIGLVTNCTRESTFKILKQLKIILHFTWIITSDDVRNPKPSSEPYLRAMRMLLAHPNDTLIVEDSVHGLTAARDSGAHVWKVSGPQDITIEALQKRIAESE